jgi:hypothetical protein
MTMHQLKLNLHSTSITEFDHLEGDVTVSGTFISSGAARVSGTFCPVSPVALAGRSDDLGDWGWKFDRRFWAFWRARCNLPRKSQGFNSAWG